MSEFAVVLSALSQSAHTARSVGADLDEALAVLGRDVAEVVSGQWRGAASAAFEASWSEWAAGARDLIAGLDRLAELVDRCAGAYAWCDDTASVGLQVQAAGL